MSSFPYEVVPGEKRHAPATERNRDALLAALREHLPEAGGRLLEVASGTGQHALHFAEQLPSWSITPSDRERAALGSIAAYRDEAALPNLLAPVPLDVVEGPWPEGPYDAVFCANMIHIAPPAATTALIRGVAGVLSAGGVFLLYGPFRFGGEHHCESNANFELWLQERDPSFGVRDADEVTTLAADAGLAVGARAAMPANNHLLVFRRG